MLDLQLFDAVIEQALTRIDNRRNSERVKAIRERVVAQDVRSYEAAVEAAKATRRPIQLTGFVPVGESPLWVFPAAYLASVDYTQGEGTKRARQIERLNNYQGALSQAKHSGWLALDDELLRSGLYRTGNERRGPRGRSGPGAPGAAADDN